MFVNLCPFLRFCQIKEFLTPHQTLCNTLNPNITASTYLLHDSAKFQSLVGATQDKIRVIILGAFGKTKNRQIMKIIRFWMKTFCLAKIIDTNLIINYPDSTNYPPLITKIFGFQIMRRDYTSYLTE